MIFVNSLIGQSQSLQVVYESNRSDLPTLIGDSVLIFHLKKHVINADFNYRKLKKFDKYTKTPEREDYFEPIPGKYYYYKFISTSTGEVYTGEPTDEPEYGIGQEILIIKTDANKHILDAYSYPLGMAESPLSRSLFKYSAKNVILRANLDIDELKLIVRLPIRDMKCDWGGKIKF